MTGETLVPNKYIASFIPLINQNLCFYTNVTSTPHKGYHKKIMLKGGTKWWDLASLTMNARTINNDVIFSNDVIVDNTTIHCQ